jgi:hypothetical protein
MSRNAVVFVDLDQTPLPGGILTRSIKLEGDRRFGT